jgi:hypothetical protein
MGGELSWLFKEVDAYFDLQRYRAQVQFDVYDKVFTGHGLWLTRDRGIARSPPSLT